MRTRVDGISVVGRNTQGVTIIKLDKKEKVIGVDRIAGLAGVDDTDSETELDDAMMPVVAESTDFSADDLESGDA